MAVRGIDWDFIAREEGRGFTQGYIPCRGRAVYTGAEPLTQAIVDSIVGSSGVTIATGFDLGQHVEGEIQAMGLGALLTDLKPYLAFGHGRPRIRRDAAEALHARPLTLDATQVATIDDAVHRSKAKDLAKRYDRATESKRPRVPLFGSLASGLQTAMVSFAFQNGNGFGAVADRADDTDAQRKEKARKRALWAAFVDQSWEAAARMLDEWGGPYRDRRRREAAVLRQGLREVDVVAGAVGAGGSPVRPVEASSGRHVIAWGRSAARLPGRLQPRDSASALPLVARLLRDLPSMRHVRDALCSQGLVSRTILRTMRDEDVLALLPALVRRERVSVLPVRRQPLSVGRVPTKAAGAAGTTARARQEEKPRPVHWIAIELVDEEDEPVPDVEYVITQPDGRQVRGRLDARGQARVSGIPTGGSCKVTFPGLDKDAWEDA